MTRRGLGALQRTEISLSLYKPHLRSRRRLQRRVDQLVLGNQLVVLVADRSDDWLTVGSNQARGQVEMDPQLSFDERDHKDGPMPNPSQAVVFPFAFLCA